MSDAQLVANLDAWLDTMRGPDGYGGPVVHWWQNCLSFTGAGLDWRYEGIISGYLTLWRRTGEARWLAKARRAGDDLVHGQLPSGNFRHSCFEANPYAGGTPHEAAADLSLLRLAIALREDGDEEWGRYAAAAENNLRCYYIGRLWDENAGAFYQYPNAPVVVPNKTCTLAEALFVWAALRGTDEPIERYALPALHAVVAIQISGSERRAGAIPQSALRGVAPGDYFPYYIARCIPALLLAYEYSDDERWLASAMAAGEFVMRHVDETGHLPQVLYTRGVNRFPQWIAPLGDVLRALGMLRPHGFSPDTNGMEAAARGGALEPGGIATARGFGAQIGQRYDRDALPDFRDNIPVAGWADKSFAWLAGRVPPGQPLPPPQTADVTIDCTVRGWRAQWHETNEEMALTAGSRALYRWRKGEAWAGVVAPEVMMR